MEALFENIYDENFDNIYRYLKFATGNEDTAKELAHEVFLALWQNLTAGRTPDNPGGWLRATAYNKVKEFYRRKKVRSGLQLKIAGKTEDASRQVLNDETYAEIAGALAALPEKEQQAIYLIDIQGIGYKKATAILKMPERSLRRLRDKTWRQLEKKFRKLNFPAELLLHINGTPGPKSIIKDKVEQ